MLHIESLALCKICIFCTFCAIHSHCPRMQKSPFLCFVFTSRLTSPLRHKKSPLLRTIRVSLSGDIRWRTPAFFSYSCVYLQRSCIVTAAFLGLCRIKELRFRWLNLENWKHSRKAKSRRLEARLRQVTRLFSYSSAEHIMALFMSFFPPVFATSRPCIWWITEKWYRSQQETLHWCSIMQKWRSERFYTTKNKQTNKQTSLCWDSVLVLYIRAIHHAFIIIWTTLVPTM